MIVVGVGGMGSAAAYELARRGRKVLGLERFGIPNQLGSSHGLSRIIRLAYFEHPDYVPLLRRAFERWRDVEREAGERLLHVTGSLDIGQPDGTLVAGSLRSCREHDLPHEVLDGAELERRHPAFRPAEGSVAVAQPDGGFLVPEACVEAHATLAQRHGATIREERVLDWEPRGDGVVVRTEGREYAAERLVLTAGAWMRDLMRVPRELAVPERQVVIWLDPPRPELLVPERFPVFIMEVDEGTFYGFPVHGGPGFKYGRYHHRYERVDPDDLDRTPHAEDEDVLRPFAERYVPAGAGPTLDMQVCLFTNSPDEHFILDVHPEHPQVTLAAGFSGHGFKFCSVVGEILADLATTGDTALAIDFLRVGRLLSEP